jgi:transketolase
MASFAATTLARLSPNLALPDQRTSARAADAIGGTRVNTARLLAGNIARHADLPPPSAGLTLPLAVLWSRTHKFDAADAHWPDRDRFVLSAATATPLLYGLLHLSGHVGMEQATLDGCGGLDSVADRSAVFGCHPAVEASAAPGGQAIAMAVGMALTERLLAARFGKSLVDHRVWSVAEAAELTQGVTDEVAALAGHLRLDRLVLLIDATNKQADDARGRYASLGWAVKSVAADDPLGIDSALSFALRSRKPTLLWFASAGGSAPTDRASANAIEAWRRVGSRGSAARRSWLKRLARHSQRAEFDRVHAGRLPETLYDILAALKQQLKVTHEPQSPAGMCRQILDRLTGCVPEMLCGHVDHVLSAGIGQAALNPSATIHCGGRYISYSNRPHGLAACANGVALHGGLLPLTACSLVDVVEQLPALRLAAMQRRRIVHLVFDPGFDGPGASWRPTELLAWLRAIPHLQMFRPACAVETTECMELALRRSDAPSLLVVSRTVTPALRNDLAENRCARGGYVLAEAEAQRRATLIATGTGLVAALAAQAILAASGIPTAVVSLPCWALFAMQDDAFRRSVLGDAPRFGVEAAGRIGWDRWLNEEGDFLGCEDTATDGPADAARQRQGLTPELIADLVSRRLASFG